MANILISPGKYVQGSNELKNLNVYAEGLGTKALALITSGGFKRIGAMVEESFKGSSCGIGFDYFNGE